MLMQWGSRKSFFYLISSHWKEVVVAEFKVPYGHLCGVTEESNYEKEHDGLSCGWDSNRIPFEDKLKALLIKRGFLWGEGGGGRLLNPALERNQSMYIASIGGEVRIYMGFESVCTRTERE
jgi:hypothetical protein